MSVLVTPDHLQDLAFRHNLTIELGASSAYITHRGTEFYAPIVVAS